MNEYIRVWIDSKLTERLQQRSQGDEGHLWDQGQEAGQGQESRGR